MNEIKERIIKAINKKKVFIGYYMLCRYLNNKGYIRYGCNAGYNKPFTKGKYRLNPCKLLCPNSKIYLTKLRYYVLKLEKENKLFLKKLFYYDSNNPNCKTKPHLLDLFVIISKKNNFKNFILSG